MALSEERLLTLLAYCRLDEIDHAERLLIESFYNSAVGYMTGAGVSEPPETDVARRAQYDLCVNAMVLDDWDNRGRTAAAAGKATENPAFRKRLNQLIHSEPRTVSNLDTVPPGGAEHGETS